MATEPFHVTPLDDVAPVVTPPEPADVEPADDAVPAAESAAPAATPDESGDGTPQAKETPATPAKAEEKPKVPTAREKLIAKLTGVEDKTEETPSTPAAETPEVPAAEIKQEPAGEKPPTTADEAPLTDAELKDVTNDDIKAMKPGEARRKINRLVSRIREAAPLAEVMQETIKACEEVGLAPKDYRNWVELGIELQRGDNPKAIKALEAIAKRAGIIPAPATNAPTMTAELDAWLTAQVADVEISATAAQEIRKRLGPVTKPAKVTPHERAATEEDVETPPAPPARRQPTPHQVASSRAVDKMATIATEFEGKIGKERFAEIEPRVIAVLASRKGSHPDSWGDIFRSAIETEIAKAPRLKTIAPPVRPGPSSTPSKPVFKTARERLIHEHT